jgi:type IV pilus assembly protein PilA
VITKIKNRMASEQGFTLIELLVVIVILGILVAIAVPSYLSFRGNAEGAAAESNVRSAIPAAEGFYQIGATYSGMNLTALQTQAPGVKASHVVVSTDKAAYCIDSVNGSHAAYYIGGDQHVGGDTNGFGTDTGVNSTVTGGAATGTGNATCATVVSG